LSNPVVTLLAQQVRTITAFLERFHRSHFQSTTCTPDSAQSAPQPAHPVDRYFAWLSPLMNQVWEAAVCLASFHPANVLRTECTFRARFVQLL
ncbi:hypothetical protein, partial [Escherichia coli]|uniref:hypothetical protein n=1 Tax=Escherichia coli TaxID=562 RepID=UPI001980227E